MAILSINKGYDETANCTDFGTSELPYLAVSDVNNSGAATVFHWNGASWVTIGSPGFSP